MNISPARVYYFDHKRNCEYRMEYDIEGYSVPLRI